MAESDRKSASNIKDTLNSLRWKLAEFSQSCDSLPRPDFGEKLDEISNWVKEQEKKNTSNLESIPIEEVGKVLITAINSIEKFKSQDAIEVASGVLDIISSVANLVGGPYGPIIGTVCVIIGPLLTKSNPQQPSVLDQLAKVVHDEMVYFNKRLHDQKYDGLKRRVSDQKSQLLVMKSGDKLDDPNLWNDYVQFMGELANRFESPLPFKYDDYPTKDPDVADFVTAVMTYCGAYCCFMALLTSAKGTFAELGSQCKEDEEAVDRKLRSQRDNTKEKLSFLSEEKYLTFLGRLPYEDGKLTKIVALSRNMRAKSVVEAVRGSLNLSPMQNLAAVESSARKVAGQSVKVEVDKHQIDAGDRVCGPITGTTDLVRSEVYSRTYYLVQFINETNFPIKVVSGRVGPLKGNFEFDHDIEPRSSCWKNAKLTGNFSTGGYLIVYLDGALSTETDPPARNARVIEFALSCGIRQDRINIQDKTCQEFTRGQDTFNTMNSDETKNLYWFHDGVHFMARGEIIRRGIQLIWRFVVQAFDPLAEEDLLQ